MNDRKDNQQNQQDKLRKHPEGQQTGEIQGDATAATGGQPGREGFGLSGGLNSGTSHGSTGSTGGREQDKSGQGAEQKEGSDKGG